MIAMKKVAILIVIFAISSLVDSQACEGGECPYTDTMCTTDCNLADNCNALTADDCTIYPDDDTYCEVYCYLGSCVGTSCKDNKAQVTETCGSRCSSNVCDDGNNCPTLDNNTHCGHICETGGSYPECVAQENCEDTADEISSCNNQCSGGTCNGGTNCMLSDTLNACGHTCTGTGPYSCSSASALDCEALQTDSNCAASCSSGSCSFAKDCTANANELATCGNKCTESDCDLGTNCATLEANDACGHQCVDDSGYSCVPQFDCTANQDDDATCGNICSGGSCTNGTDCSTLDTVEQCGHTCNFDGSYVCNGASPCTESHSQCGASCSSGSCSYNFDCTAMGKFCLEGACVDCLSDNDCHSTDDESCNSTCTDVNTCTDGQDCTLDGNTCLFDKTCGLCGNNQDCGYDQNEKCGSTCTESCSVGTNCLFDIPTNCNATCDTGSCDSGGYDCTIVDEHCDGTCDTSNIGECTGGTDCVNSNNYCGGTCHSNKTCVGYTDCTIVPGMCGSTCSEGSCVGGVECISMKSTCGGSCDAGTCTGGTACGSNEDCVFDTVYTCVEKTGIESTSDTEPNSEPTGEQSIDSESNEEDINTSKTTENTNETTNTQSEESTSNNDNISNSTDEIKGSSDDLIIGLSIGGALIFIIVVIGAIAVIIWRKKSVSKRPEIFNGDHVIPPTSTSDSSSFYQEGSTGASSFSFS
eukprot:TRINITY_DN6760_c0_g1_i1.p1 TRINITY_DN6760_c0_g1~~TRINITY_DN6760_c0_g1_i1.p1  ORF type:complete len:699 (-),score=156.75 TRINITY_DN6760_c0_g1_i1:55-2151(-)